MLIMSHASDADMLDDLLQRRRSCRAFLPQPVAREVVARMLGMAQRTASWCNTQPWQVVVTREQGTERFRAAYAAELAAGKPAPDLPFPREYHDVYQERRRECGFQLYECLGVQRGDRVASTREALRNYEFFGAPHVAIITTDEALGQYGAIDCGAYVANLLLSAEALGLGAIAQAALASHSGFVRDHLALGHDRRVVCGVSFGYADTAHPANGFRTSRASMDQTVTWLEG
jgi:nitroreductase